MWQYLDNPMAFFGAVDLWLERHNYYMDTIFSIQKLTRTTPSRESSILLRKHVRPDSQSSSVSQ